VTPGDAIEIAPEPLADGRTLAVIKSDGRTPPMPWIVPAGSAAPKPIAPELLPASYPARLLVDPKLVVVKAADGVEIHCALFEQAPAAGAARRPAIIEVHSGPNHEHEMLGWGWSHEYDMNQYLASRGYVVLAVNTRGGSGFGRAFREAPGVGAAGASDYQDVLAAVHYLRGRPDVDPARIGIYGISNGGYLTQLALARNSDLFAAGVSHAGMYDLAARIGATGEAGKIARDASPVGSIDKWQSPSLIIHSDGDGNVDISQTVALVQALRARNVPFELLIVPDEGHFFMTYGHLLRERRATADFFDRTLKASTTKPPTAGRPEGR
jgi:dipeptidyl aminopeptidase/acylaminoacyl peptidase